MHLFSDRIHILQKLPLHAASVDLFFQVSKIIIKKASTLTD